MNRSVWFLGLVCLAQVCLCPTAAQSQCVKSTSKQFASKTAYRNSGAPQTADLVAYGGCKPVQIYAILRHGTRYPGASDVSDMISKVPRLRDAILSNVDMGRNHQICQEDLMAMKNWQLNFNGSSTNLLAPEGVHEIKLIAKRLQVRFPSLLSAPYSPSIYKFRATKTPRTLESAKAFAKGLFDTDKGVDYDIVQSNELLRFYKTCGRWEKEVDDNETALAEFYAFKDHPLILDMLSRVGQRLGFDEPISYYNATILYEMCRFDTAWNPQQQSSAWCNLFDNADLQLLEYAEDLSYYWKDGYGYSLNYEQACPVVEDLLTSFKSASKQADQSKSPAGLFHFTHSGMLLKFYARLGLYQDDQPLLSTNYQKQWGRKWKTSLIDPFSANIVFVLFNCSTVGDSGGQRAEFKVVTYVQEQEVILQNCTSPLCSLQTVIDTYGQFADTCNLETLCNSNSNTSSTFTVSAIILAMALAIVTLWTIR